MGTFDSYADSPFQIRTEGQEITIRFNRTGPNTGRISWNIPNPALGCSAEDQAYNGIVVTLDTSHTSVDKIPTDGTVYTSDPTADTNLHAGDKIGSSLVVGAFYNDKTTTFFDVSGLKPNTAYYVSGFAVDKVHRYHHDGVHAYALDYEMGNETQPTSGYQELLLGIEQNDSTNLLSQPYTFDIHIDGKDYSLVIDGTFAQTYADVVSQIDKQLSKIHNPPQGPSAPNTGAYYWSATSEELFQWDGSQHNELNVIVENTDPSNPNQGDYWFNPDTNVLSQWIGSPGAWTPQTYISYLQDPTTLGGDDYWFTGSNVYHWEGNTWCEKILWNQITDPSQPTYPAYGTYWYDSTNLLLYKWNDQTKSWDATDAIYWNTDPNNLTVGTYWFDDSTNTLYSWNGASFDQLTAIVSSSGPSAPAPNTYWFNPETEELKQRNAGNTAWNDLDVLVFDIDPTDRTTCDLWWNSNTDTLHVWDITTTSWDQVTNFLQQSTDPTLPPNLSTEDMWYSSQTEILKRWDGSMWQSVTFIKYATDPTIVSDGDVWFNTTDNKWYERSASPSSWVEFDPVEALQNPNTPATGTFWYDTSNDELKQWNGASWVSVLFTTIPLTPTVGDLWYDTTNDILKEWTTNGYVPAILDAIVEITSEGNIRFTSSTTGSESVILLTDGTLFTSLSQFQGIGDYVLGTDGVDPEPMYQQLGVGDDGTPDERRELIDSIRQQLGAPVVEVELTKYQMDTAITAALEALRKRSAAAYKRGFFFVDIPEGEQAVKLTNKTVGFNKIVTVMSAHRITSAFLTTAYGSGVYGQVVLQHLYNMGTFDLLSYHLMSEYIEQLEQLFATRLVFSWNEQTRSLAFHQTFAYDERILIDATIERTEQDLLTDRWTKSWIEKYASAHARLMLAEIRGKYAALPGAGGGVSLNAAELITRAETDIQDCLEQLDDFIVNPVEDFGIGTAFVIG